MSPGSTPVDNYPVEGLPTPDPSLSPKRVVQIQLEALARNDTPVENAGIGTAYNFASPENRRATGPLTRFTRMVESPRFAPMIDYEEAVRGPLERRGSRAEQTVTITGPGERTVTYTFGVSEQSTGPFAGCWLTDRVVIE